METSLSRDLRRRIIIRHISHPGKRPFDSICSTATCSLIQSSKRCLVPKAIQECCGLSRLFSHSSSQAFERNAIAFPVIDSLTFLDPDGDDPCLKVCSQVGENRGLFSSDPLAVIFNKLSGIKKKRRGQHAIFLMLPSSFPPTLKCGTSCCHSFFSCPRSSSHVIILSRAAAFPCPATIVHNISPSFSACSSVS